MKWTVENSEAIFYSNNPYEDAKLMGLKNIIILDDTHTDPDSVILNVNNDLDKQPTIQMDTKKTKSK